MSRQEGQKSKLLALLRILEQETDENHRLNVPQLVEKLEQQGIPCERKSIYTDIDALRETGYDIQLLRGRGGGYWMANRTFDLPELKLLVDAVQSSRAIPATTSKRLIKKLEGLTSRHEAGRLQRFVYVDGRPKTANKTLIYSVDTLFEAINQDRMVRFHYRKGSLTSGQKATVYTVSPWQMAWENGSYYLIAYQDEKNPAGVRNYRPDRMSRVTILDEPRRGRELFRDFDLPAYLRKHFNMFGGEERKVTLRCAPTLESTMRERFGTDVIFITEDDGSFHFTVPVCVSSQFFGWVSGFGGTVEITGPEDIRADFRQKMQALADRHA